MQELVFKTIYVTLLLVSVFIRGRLLIKQRKNPQKLVLKKSVKEKIMVRISYLGMVLIPLIYVFSNWFNSFNLHFPLWARSIGVSGFAITILLYWWTHKTLDKNWSAVLEIKKEHKLITEGPYRYVRHPMYTVFWMWVIFQGLLLSNALVWLVGVVTWAVTYITRIDNEEEMMIDQFGDEYIEYMKKTRRLIPKCF